MSHQIVESDVRKTIVINQYLYANNTFSFNFINKIGFKPKYVVIRQLFYSNVQWNGPLPAPVVGADDGIYLIWSSLTNDYIGAVYVGIQAIGMTPNTVIPLFGNVPSTVTFTVSPANSSFVAPTGNLTMVLEFIGF